MDIAPLRSEPRNFGNGAVIPFPTQFLEIGRRFRAPCIEHLELRLNLNVTTAAANTLQSRDIPTALAKVQVSDAVGDRLNLRGSSLRIVNICEDGACYNDGPNVAPSTTTTVNQILRVPFRPKKARRPHDFLVPLDEFLEGGQLQVQCNNGTLNGVAGSTATINSGTVQWFAYIVEDRERELKSRMAWLDTDITQKEYGGYPVQGLLRYALAFCGEVGVFNARNWGTQNVTSRTLDLSVMPSDELQDAYKGRQAQGVRTADPSATVKAEDPSDPANNQVIPVFFPRPDQKMTQLPDVSTLHFQFDGTLPATGDIPKLITCSVTDRSMSAAMRTLKAANPGTLAAHLDARGYFKGANGKAHPVGKLPDNLARKLPLKLATDKETMRQISARK